ncbi:MAG: class I SAM-dependent methyltransferase [Acidimicrobiales bacterium]
MPPSHDDVVRRSFEGQLDLFSGPTAPFAMRSGDLAWIEPLDEAMVVLDVACGAGHAAQTVAPRVRQVVGVDLTPALLELGASRLRHDGVANVLLQRANAHDLPFVDETFDVVFCRSALHHLERPEAAVAEMVRVCRHGGRIVLVDLIAPTGAVRQEFDALHRLLDPSHVRCFLESELAALLPGGTDALVYASTLDIRLPVDIAFSELSTVDEVVRRLRAEVEGKGPPSGFEPADEDGALTVTFPTCTVHAERP